VNGYDEITAVGRELLADRAKLERRLLWFTNYEQGGGEGLFEMGRVIGREDADALLLMSILAAAANAKNPVFSRGYVLGLTEKHSSAAEKVRAALDELESRAPAVALDLSTVHVSLGRPAGRAVRLVRDKKLPVEILGRPGFVGLEGPLLAEAIALILDVSKDEQERAAATALHLLGPFAVGKKAKVLDDPQVVEAAWTALEVAIHGAMGDAYYWGGLLARLAEKDPDRGIALSCRALTDGDLFIQDEASGVVSTLASRHPARTMTVLGSLLLDKKCLLRSPGGRRGSVVASIPFEVLKSWLSAHGVDAARVLATHLPAPHLDGDGNPVVPPLTEYVLEHFEDDEEVFRSFCIGLHDFQVYYGDIAEQHEKEAADAEKFLSHPLRRVHEWAEYEIESAKRSAKWTRERYEEEFDD
jgi:hypothetical protein